MSMLLFYAVLALNLGVLAMLLVTRHTWRTAVPHPHAPRWGRVTLALYVCLVVIGSQTFGTDEMGVWFFCFFLGAPWSVVPVSIMALLGAPSVAALGLSNTMTFLLLGLPAILINAWLAFWLGNQLGQHFGVRRTVRG